MKVRQWIAGICAIGLLAGEACAVETSAASAILMEQKSGRVLYEKNADEERLIASITKIMTALVALENGDPAQKYTVTEQDMAEGSSMYLRPGEEIRLEELLYGLMLSSGNDAALAVAHCVSGSTEAFVDEMNRRAESLGMTHTHFANPNGLDAEEHFSSACDMAILTSCALEREDFRRIVSTTSISLGERRLVNHNKLLRLCDGCIGVKTGFTRAAGRTLVSASQRDGMTLVCVTLRDGNDWQDHIDLYTEGFSCCRRKIAARRGQPITEVRVRGGSCTKVVLAAAEELSYPVREGETLSLRAEGPISVEAPVFPGQVLGRVTVCLDGSPVAAADLVSVSASARETGERHG